MFGPKLQKLNIVESAIKEVLERRLEPEGIFPNKEEVIKRFQSGERLRVYLGIDPTGPEIHLGHTIPLLFLKQLWELGHMPVIVIGDFTARIGDPSGKDNARKPLSEEEIKNNMGTYLTQLYKILPKGSFELNYNSSWLEKLNFADVIKLASHSTVQQMIQRDMFQERLKAERPIGVHEFLYPLMQGYDSVAMEIDGEVGGNDQTFNMLVGRDLEHKLLNKDKLVFATRLLVSSSGKKMSKSEGSLIALNDNPQDIFGKTMASIPDEMIKSIFELCTEKPIGWINENSGPMSQNPYEWKKKLAFELVAMYHNENEAQKAAQEFEKVFSKKELPEEIQEFAGNGMEIIDIITSSGMVESRSEAKRLLEQGGVKVNQETVKDWMFKPNQGDIVQVGPRKFVKIK
ncbi:tyrosine--tRNA ligase [Candidatus Parcubacteria bacterium]|nr:tyrosine--tRNA ligase [Candidatus Parcubacteria bacterium]